MSWFVLIFSFLLFWVSSCAAQTAGKPAQPAQIRVRQEPCWQQAGVSQGAIEERDAIARDRRTQVEAVCADTSLTVPQKQEKIREIRHQAKEKIDSAISPQQQEEIQACQKERAANRPSAAPVHAKTGPCGELINPRKSGSGADAGNAEEENR
jgi:hypothetical protein